MPYAYPYPKGRGYQMRDSAKLTAIENNHEITCTSDPHFWYEYQSAVLLALQEEGILSAAQYRYADEQLKRQLRMWEVEQ